MEHKGGIVAESGGRLPVKNRWALCEKFVSTQTRYQGLELSRTRHHWETLIELLAYCPTGAGYHRDIITST